MKIIETEPDKLLNSDYINQLDILLNSLNAALIIEKDRDVIHFSPFLSEIGIDYHNILQKQVETTNRTDGIIRISDTLFVKTIPVDYSDNTTGTLFLINDSTIAAEELKTFKNSVIYTLILFLIIMIIINTLITYLLSRQIVSPIVRLKNAAQLIQKGNYDFQLKSPSKDEIGSLFLSFEEARKQLKKSEETQKIYEQSRNELITNISHDLKTPITTIKGYIEGIMDGIPKSKEKEDKYLQTIYQNALNMESLIEDLFLLSRFDLNQSLYQFENINIKDFLSDSYEELQFYLMEKNIKLEYIENYEGQKLVKADRQQLKRVIINIINNAINYKNVDDPEIKIVLTERKHEAQIEIRDNGRGISEDMLDKVFERFYKADRSRSNNIPGTGLGLYIARKIINDHGGSIWAKSKINKGTSIFFTLLKIEKNSHQ